MSLESGDSFSPFPLWGRSDWARDAKHQLSDPGEGLRSHDRPQPLTPTLSHKGRGSSPPMPAHRAISIKMDPDSSNAVSSAHRAGACDDDPARPRATTLKGR